VSTPHAALDAIERYYDGVPRAAARAERIGPFTLFVRTEPGFPYYARPTLGEHTFTPSDVARVRARQRELGVPQSFEWVAEVSPGLRPAIGAAGLAVHTHPLLVLSPSANRRLDPPPGADVRLVEPEDEKLGQIMAAAGLAFGHPGTASGPVGLAELAAASLPAEAAIQAQRQRLRAGLTVSAVAFIDGQPVASGSHQPLGRLTEIVGVGTLPAFRRRGLGAAVTARLVEDALRRNLEIVFLSADDDAVARVYARLGFERVATACIAEPPG
jgi:ribosomal protein S18 acetylase RimI-like enzyme